MAILEYLNDLPSCYARKCWGGPYGGGWPDILGAFRGYALALEVKTPTGKVTKLQVQEIHAWTQAGAISGVVRSVEDVQTLLTLRGLL
ncbi:VRR-NUC domain-containing protein [Nitrospira sp. Nam74]